MQGEVLSLLGISGRGSKRVTNTKQEKSKKSQGKIKRSGGRQLVTDYVRNVERGKENDSL